ncbi:hypothetical protein RJ639_009223 [Escallonia herrerae]|uniref:Reverse transcriptase Ty1/copia-type domain-containing protein n=1 Tax=Escallonia herrerae TaxID=1293975 RepID=A0AA89ARP0_9ASTE|nr:hypothetical protein RJ639_009223 [Escallonia herrerae]
MAEDTIKVTTESTERDAQNGNIGDEICAKASDLSGSVQDLDRAISCFETTPQSEGETEEVNAATELLKLSELGLESEEIYMKIPREFAKQDEGCICRLQKFQYGVRYESRNWCHKFATPLLAIAFRQSDADRSLFPYSHGGSFVAAFIYVDDAIITGKDITCIPKL